MATTVDMEFKECLNKGKIKEFSRGRALFKKELKTAGKDLEQGLKTFKEGGYKWSSIQSYYSMFHSARSLLYFKNYREKSHYCLIIAIRVLYVQTGLLSVSLVEALQKAKDLREAADYYDEWSKDGAERLLENSKEFLKEAKKIVVSNK